ncbi:MAG: putative deacylase [Pseudohongiellaceae bacterium]|jgi:predicted deacylase
MKTLAILLLSIGLIHGAAQAADDAPALTSSTDRYTVSRAARDVLVGMKATVLHGSGDGDFTAILAPDEVATLRGAGFDPRPLPAGHPDASGSAGAAEGGWTPYAQMRADYVAYAANYPAIASFEVIGQSLQGRDIFGLRISDNVSVEEDEPEMMFLANIHGDEFASGEIAYQWAMELLDDYGTDPVATGFVDDNEIWVLPLLNPDGHEMGTRNNAAGVDLNRDWGINWDGWGGSTAPWSQIESRVLQAFLMDNNVTLSVTMHCSGNVFLYPWCYQPAAAPEDPLIQLVGALYANAANYQLKNSWFDYETHGELIDTVYGGHGALSFTAEISNNLAQYADSYSRNKAGMDAFCAVAGEGLHGLVTDAATGLPLRAAVRVSGSPYPAYTDATVGDVHRMVRPGSYSVAVSANGYQTQTVSGLTVNPGGTTDFAVALAPGGGHSAFAVTTVDLRDPNNVHANISSPADALGPTDGQACSLGFEGFIVLDMGEGQSLSDGPGDDFIVTEAMVPGDQQLESYTVWVGDAYQQSTLVGAGVGTTSFDLSGTGFATARYVKIKGTAEQSANDPLCGLELDSLTVLGGGFVSIGPGTPGAFGTPVLAGSGDLTPGGEGFTLAISSVAPNANGILFVGLTESMPALTLAGTAFHMGLPWIVELPLAVDASGSLSFGGSIDVNLSGLNIASQALWADTSGPTGKATATNGLRLEVP